MVASGENFPDALSGSVLASNYSSSIILVDKPLLQVTSDYLKGQNYKTINILSEGIFAKWQPVRF